MAFLKFKDNKCRTMPTEKALVLWQVMTGEVQGSQRQKEFARTVDRIWFGKDGAPASWLAKYHPDEKEVWYQR